MLLSADALIVLRDRQLDAFLDLLDREVDARHVVLACEFLEGDSLRSEHDVAPVVDPYIEPRPCMGVHPVADGLRKRDLVLGGLLRQHASLPCYKDARVPYRGKEGRAMINQRAVRKRVDHAQRWYLRDEVNEVIDLLRGCPDLSEVHHLNALAKSAKGRNRETDPHKLDKKLSAHLFGLSIFRVFAIPDSINEPQISVLIEH